MSHYFKVKDFDRFQHYKDRSPPWIKLYNALLDDYAFGCLQDASKMHLVAIWLLASRSDNKLPRDPAWLAKRINATEPVDLDTLEKAGFIITIQEDNEDASNALAKRLTRDREETEGERETNGEVGAQVLREKVSGLNEERRELYSETERKALAFEFDGVDVGEAIIELTRWCARKGVTDPIEQKNMIFGALKKRHGKAKAAESMNSPGSVTASSQLANSRMTQAPRGRASAA